MNETLQIFIAGSVLGSLVTCVVFSSRLARALNGWERAQNRIETLEKELNQLREDMLAPEDWEQLRDKEEKDWK